MARIVSGFAVLPNLAVSVMIVLVAWTLAGPVAASDHADPTFNRKLDAGMTGLFVFPTKDGKEMVIILCTRRLLDKFPPFEELNQFKFKIHMDLHTPLDFSNPSDLARYGGTVTNPAQIQEDVTITIELDSMARFKEQEKDRISGKGLVKKTGISWWSGVRDDPFIFPQFFGTNVIAVAISIPFECFPGGQEDWLIWATSERRGVQIDHVGRSQRTQLPRFDFLNTIHPSKHVAAIQQRQKNPDLLHDIARTQIPTEFAIRPYDLHPDVLIFTKKFAAKFPNGRQLTDDIAKLTCEQGDCQLFELSFARPKLPGSEAAYENDRPISNDKKFLDQFPYLADPWPNPMPTPAPQMTTRNWLLLLAIVIFVGIVVLFPWVLYFRALRRLKCLADKSVVLHRQSTVPSPP